MNPWSLRNGGGISAEVIMVWRQDQRSLITSTRRAQFSVSLTSKTRSWGPEFECFHGSLPLAVANGRWWPLASRLRQIGVRGVDTNMLWHQCARFDTNLSWLILTPIWRNNHTLVSGYIGVGDCLTDAHWCQSILKLVSQRSRLVCKRLLLRWWLNK